MTKRVVLIKHEDSPGDDRAATWLAEQGFQLDWRAPYNGDSLGQPGEDVSPAWCSTAAASASRRPTGIPS